MRAYVKTVLHSPEPPQTGKAAYQILAVPNRSCWRTEHAKTVSSIPGPRLMADHVLLAFVLRARSSSQMVVVETAPPSQLCSMVVNALQAAAIAEKDWWRMALAKRARFTTSKTRRTRRGVTSKDVNRIKVIRLWVIARTAPSLKRETQLIWVAAIGQLVVHPNTSLLTGSA